MKLDEFSLVKPILEAREEWRFEDKLLCRQFHGPVDERTTGPEAEEVYSFWKEAQNHFSTLSLSNPTDRLVAIQGLMTAVARYTKWDPVFGLWGNFCCARFYGKEYR
jgi:hypothetical protein